MIIKKVDLQSFGKFQNQAFEFDSGINIVYGRNEKGKTTIHKFIEAVLFGVTKKYAKFQNDLQEDYEKYRPWYNKDEYKGSLVIEVDGEDYEIQRDFLKADNQIVITKLSTGEILNDEETAVIMQVGKDGFLNMLGISSLSNTKGKNLINEIRERIVNLKNAKSGSISYEYTVRELEKRIEEIQSDTYVKESEQNLATCEKEKQSLYNVRSELKSLLRKMYEVRKAVSDLEAEQEVIDRSIAWSRFFAIETKFQKVQAMNEEIEVIKSEVEKLEIFNITSKDTVEDYLFKIDEIEGIESQVQEATDNYNTLKTESDELNLHASEEAIKLLAEDMYASDFIMDFENYNKVKNQLTEMEEDIKGLRRQLEFEASNEKKVEISEQEIERDYFEIMGAVNAQKRLESLVRADQDIVLNQTKLDDLKLRQKPLMMWLSISIVALLASVSIFIFVPALEMFSVLSSGVFAAAVLVCIFFVMRNSQETSQTNYLLAHLKNEHDNNVKAYEAESKKVEMIIAKYNFYDVQAFEEFYFSRKKNKGDESSLFKKITDLEQKRDQVKFNENMLYRRINKWMKDAEIYNEISIEDGDEAIYYIEERSKKCIKFVNLNNSMYRIEHEISKLQREIDVIRKEMQNQEKFQPLHPFKVDEIRKKLERYFELIQRREQVYMDQEEELRGASIASLETNLEKERKAIATVSNVGIYQENVDDLNARNLNVKDSIISGTQQMAELAKTIGIKQQQTNSVKELNRKIEAYKKVIENNQEKLSKYQEALYHIKQMSKVIVDSFSGELNNHVGEILYRITDTYNEVVIDNEFDIFVKEMNKEGVVPLDTLSLGTIDQIYFAMRLGLIDTINADTSIPLILDDIFIQYDDERLENVLHEIAKFDRQIIILSCQKREKQAYSFMHQDFNFVTI